MGPCDAVLCWLFMSWVAKSLKSSSPFTNEYGRHLMYLGRTWTCNLRVIIGYSSAVTFYQRFHQRHLGSVKLWIGLMHSQTQHVKDPQFQQLYLVLPALNQFLELWSYFMDWGIWCYPAAFLKGGYCRSLSLSSQQLCEYKHASTKDHQLGREILFSKFQ